MKKKKNILCEKQSLTADSDFVGRLIAYLQFLGMDRSNHDSIVKIRKILLISRKTDVIKTLGDTYVDSIVIVFYAPFFIFL